MVWREKVVKIDQIYYTRLDEGWGIAKATEEISEKFKNAFQSINAQNPADKTILSFDAFDGGYALSRSVSAGIDSFGRAKFFVHGYLFSELDSDEIFNNFGCFLNIRQFSENVDCDITPISSLPLENVRNIQIEKSKLPNLLECVYEAVLQNKKLEIKIPNDNDEDALRLIMNAIYGYLPVYLRKFISFSSCIGGIIRMITLTHEFSGAADITYDYEFNIANGISKTYIDIIERLINDRDNIISKIEKYIKNAVSTVTLDEGEYKKAFDYVMFEANESIDKDDTISKLLDLLLEKKYSDASSAAYISVLIKTCVQNNADISNSMHGMIMDAYFGTNQPVLKDSIEKYIAYSYKKRCSEEDFEKLKVFKTKNPYLYRMVYNIAIAKGNGELARYVALDVINNSDASDYIVEECDAACRNSIAHEIAKIILESKDILYIDNIVKRSMHKDVMEIVILNQPDKVIMWEYIRCIFNNKIQYDIFSNGLTQSAHTNVENFCVKEIDENTADILYAAWKTDIELGKKIVNLINGKEKYRTIEKFYTQYLLEDMTTPEDVKNLCAEVINVRKKIGEPCFTESEFTKRVLRRYVSVSQKNCIDRSTTIKQIDRLKDFGRLIQVSVNKYANQLKARFWMQFDYNDWHAGEDYSALYIQNNKDSNIDNKIYLVTVMSELVKMITSCAYIIDNDLKHRAISLLIDNKSYLNKRVRDMYINKVRDRVESCMRLSENRIDMDIVLLLNYSNVKESLDRNINLRDLKAVRMYIEHCAETYEKSVIDYPAVFIDLYKIVLNKRDDSLKYYDNKIERCRYDSILKALDGYINNFEGKEKRNILKEIKVLKREHSLKGSLALASISLTVLLFVFAYAFVYVDLLLSDDSIHNMVKASIIMAGIVAVAVDEIVDFKRSGQSIAGVITGFVTGAAMFLTFIVALTTIV